MMATFAWCQLEYMYGKFIFLFWDKVGQLNFWKVIILVLKFCFRQSLCCVSYWCCYEHQHSTLSQAMFPVFFNLLIVCDLVLYFLVLYFFKNYLSICEFAWVLFLSYISMYVFFLHVYFNKILKFLVLHFCILGSFYKKSFYLYVVCCMLFFWFHV